MRAVSRRIQAGRLDREITIQRAAETIDAAGSIQTTWTPLADMRAALLKTSIVDVAGESGSTTKARLTFQVRYLEGITLNDRIIYRGDSYAIKEIREIGRNRCLEIDAERT